MAKKIKFDPKFGLRGMDWVHHNCQNNMVTYIFFSYLHSLYHLVVKYNFLETW